LTDAARPGYRTLGIAGGAWATYCCRMTQNEALIRRMFDELINLGKLDLVDELFDDDFRTETPQGVLDREGFRQYVADWRTGFADIHCEVGDFVVEGDKVAWSVKASGTHTGTFMGIPATGRTVDFDSLNIGVVRDGRGWRHKVVMDTAAILGQLGLLPGPEHGGA
jgi:predicted ester cyclase